MAKDSFKINPKDIKIRKRFSRNPSEQVEEPEKGAPYCRSKEKFDLRKQLEEEEADNQDIDFDY